MEVIAFGFGLLIGFVCGVVPDLIRQASYKKHTEWLAEFRPLDPDEDPEDRAEREKEEAEHYRFF